MEKGNLQLFDKFYKLCENIYHKKYEIPSLQKQRMKKS